MEDGIPDNTSKLPNFAEEPKSRSAKAPDRVTLNPSESDRVASWIKQLEIASNGFLDLNKSDLVGFLIREHKTELSPKEIQTIRTHHYDPVKHLNWITPRLIDAIAKNEMAKVAMLQTEIRSIELSVIADSTNCAAAINQPAPKEPRKRRKSTTPIANENSPLLINSAGDSA
jgi:hypothetical protein